MHSYFFFFNDTATTEIYTLSLHDALPIFGAVLEADRARQPGRKLAMDLALRRARADRRPCHQVGDVLRRRHVEEFGPRSEEHTSELQSQSNLVCRLLLEKKKICHDSSFRSSLMSFDWLPLVHS